MCTAAGDTTVVQLTPARGFLNSVTPRQPRIGPRVRRHSGGDRQHLGPEPGDLTIPRRNRVTPFGEIVATPERGTMMGNRGILHDAEGRIRRPWQVKRWLLCVLEFKERHR